MLTVYEFIIKIFEIFSKIPLVIKIYYFISLVIFLYFHYLRTYLYPYVYEWWRNYGGEKYN